MTRTDRSKGKPGYIPTWRPADDRPDARRKAVRDRKARFEALNAWINHRGGAWLTSIPGDFEVMMECLPSSNVPQRLGDLCYQLRPEGEGERILPHAIVERFCRNGDGTLVPITEGSTLSVVHRVTHAGIVETRKWSFSID
jgi:hypothetical protein